MNHVNFPHCLPSKQRFFLSKSLCLSFFQFIVVLCFCSPAVASVTPLGATAQITQTNTLSFTVPAGTNRLLVVTASDAENTNNIISVNFGVSTMTKQSQVTDNYAVDAVFTLVLGSSASSTTANIVMTSNSAIPLSGKSITANVFSNVDQANPIGDIKTNQNTVIPSVSTLNVISSSGDLVFDIFDSYNDVTGGVAASAGTGQTITNSANFALLQGFGFYSTSTKSGATNVPMAWTTTDHDALIHIALNIKQLACTNPTSYNVTGGGAYCVGGSGVVVGLSNSETGVNYQLKLGGVNSGSPVSGTTGNAISFGNKTAVGNYTVEATTAVGACTNTMTGSVNISTNPNPTPTITGLNAVYCKTSGVITLAGNPSGGSFMVNGSAASSFDTDLLTTGATNTVNYSYTDGNGCSGTAPQATFQVLAIPPAVTLTANAVSPQCLNSTVTITAPAADKYAWYKNGAFLQWSNSPNNTLAVTASSTTATYNVYTYNAATNFCPSALSNTISVVGTFPVAAITPSFAGPYCLNKVPVLSASTGPGYTYSWTCPTCSTTTNTPTLTPTAQNGNYTVTVTDGNGCSKTSSTLNVVLNAVPTVNAGADFSTCIAFPVALGNTNTTTGYTYQWTPSTNLSSATVGKPNVSPTSTTPITYTLRVTRTSTGCYAEDDVVVTGIAQPDATTLVTSSSAAVCQPSSITLTPGVVNNVFWYKNGAIMSNTPSSGARTFFSSALNGDIYTVRNFDGTCKSNESNPITLNIKSAPAPTITATPAITLVGGSYVASICNQQTTGTAALTANIPSGAPAVTNYNWQQFLSGMNNNLSPAVTTNNYTASVSTAQNNKSFRVQATYANGCTNSSINIFVKLQPVGCSARMNGEAEENLAESFIVYPNPTENSLNISLANFATETGDLILYNTLGQVIFSESISLSAGKAEQSWDLTSLSPGIYNLVFQTEKGQSVQKIVKE